jgi:hypothetical protein
MATAQTDHRPHFGGSVDLLATLATNSRYSSEVTSERTGYSDQRATTLLKEALRGRGGKLTRADAIVASGLPDEEAGRALTVLLKEYRSHLSATETGELLYEFDPSFARRDAIPWRERAAAVAARLWKGFTVLFKVAIVATLIGYFALFVAMMVALVFARSSSDRDDDGGGFGFDGLLWFWGWDTGWGGSGYGRPARRARSKPRAPFYKRVFAFVFGPPAPAVDPLADEKRIAAYVRNHEGRIAAVDLVRLMGWSFPRAEEEVTRLMVDYGGEPEVTDDGVVIYTFKALRKTAGRAGTDESPPCWASERLEAARPLTGNEPATDGLVALFNGFNLLAPFWVVPAFEQRLHVSLAGWQFLFRDFPLAFSAVFFAIPAGRWIKARVEASRRRARNDRRRLLGRIFALAGAGRREELAPTPELGALLDRELVSLGGDVATEPDDQGRILYTFPRIDEELAALAKARAAAPVAERDAGEIIFSSRN